MLLNDGDGPVRQQGGGVGAVTLRQDIKLGHDDDDRDGEENVNDDYNNDIMTISGTSFACLPINVLLVPEVVSPATPGKHEDSEDTEHSRSRLC